VAPNVCQSVTVNTVYGATVPYGGCAVTP
jgi:hypothetical protein